MRMNFTCACGCGQYVFEDGDDIVVKIPLKYGQDSGGMLLSDWVLFLERRGEKYLERRITRKKES